MGAALSTLGFGLLLLLAAGLALRGKFWPAVLAAVALSLYVRLPQAPIPIFNIDEAINAAIARRLQDGAVLYGSVWDHKPPLSFYLYRLVFDLAGSWNMTAIHLTGALLNALAILLVAMISRRLLPGKSASWPAIFLAVYGLLYFRYDFLATNHELGGLPFLLGAVLLFWRGRESAAPRRRAAWLAGAGALGMTAGLFKEPCATILAVCGLFLLLEPFLSARGAARETSLRTAWARGWRDVAAFSLGACLPLAVFLLWLLVHGTLRDAWYLIITHNLRYRAAGKHGLRWFIAAVAALRSFLRFGPAFWISGLASLVFLGLRAARAAGQRRPVDPAGLFLFLWCLGAGWMAGQGGRFHGHYFLLCYPPFALAIGSVLGMARRSWVMLIAPAIALLSLPFYYQYQARDHAQCFESFVLGRREVVPRFDDIMVTQAHLDALPVLRAMAGPDEPVFIWGFSPQLYVLAPRKMATRFPFTSILTGVTVEGRRISTDPRLWDLLKQDLERERPAVVVDAADLFLEDLPLEEFPEFRTWLMQRYRPVLEIRKCRFYERADRPPTKVLP